MPKGAAKRQKPTPATTSPERTSAGAAVTTYPPVPPVPLRPMRRLLVISAILFAGWVSFLLYLYATTDQARSPAGAPGLVDVAPPAEARPAE